MTKSDSNGDKILKEYLSGGSGVSRAYRQQVKDEPSAAVDEAIRAAAKREVHSAPRPIVNPFGRHWTVPASLAAMLLLSVGLVIFMSDETGVAPYSSDILEEEVTEHDLALPAARQDRLADDKAASPAISSPSGSFSQGVAGRSSEKKEATIKSAAPVPAIDARKRLRSEGMRKLKRKMRVQQKAGGIQAEPKLQKKAPAMKPDATRPVLQMEMEAPAENADRSILAPELWLAQVKALRAQGKTKEAEASLAEFRKIYPDYPLDSLHK